MDLSGVCQHRPATVSDGQASAVLVPVLAGEPRLLLHRRADHLETHPGEMSFPGGRREPGDATLRATAMREAGEEVGLDGGEVTVVGRLDDILTVTGFAVRPFVARVPDRGYRPRSPEVAETVLVPVAALTDPDSYDSEHREHPDGGRVRVHYFRVDGHTIWGATARILVQLLELTTDWTPPDLS